jgi:hypothetical protein
MDTRLTEAGIDLNDIESRLDGQGKILVITTNELVYADESGLQRAPLRQVTKVAIDKSGSLGIRSATSDLITGNIRGFDLTNLKFFLEGAKSSIAKAKAMAKSPTITESAPAIPVIPEPTPAVTPRANTGTLGDDAWGQDPGLRQPTFDTWSTTKASDMQTKSSSEMNKSFEIAPDDDEPVKSFADKLEWAEDAGVAPTSIIAPHLDTRPLQTQQLETVPTNLSSQAPLSSTDVHSEVHEWDETFKNSQSQAALQTAASNSVSAQGAADWSGDILEASTSLQTPESHQMNMNSSQAINVSKDPTPTIDRPMRIGSLPNLAPIARWLRIMSLVVGLLGVAGAALLFPKDISTLQDQPLQLLAVFSSLFVGVMFALISYGLAELFTAWGSLAADVRSIKRERLE